MMSIRRTAWIVIGPHNPDDDPYEEEEEEAEEAVPALAPCPAG